MRKVLGVSLGLSVGGVVVAFVACGGSNPTGFSAGDSGTFPVGDGGAGRDTGILGTGTGTGGDSGHMMMAGDTGTMTGTDGDIITTKTTIYAHTDTELYSMDPMTKAITDLGTFKGMSGSYYDATMTDLAVDAAGEIYVNSEQVIYKAALPATPGPGATVQLTEFLNTDPTLPDGGTLATKYYALAFAPAGAIGVSTIPSGETLVAGDSNGELWVFQPGGAAAKDVGNFGADPNIPANFLSLSGDLVFYTNSSNQPTGLATIRSCSKSSSTGKVTCTKTNDYLAAINMANLKANASAATPSASLLAGIYGGTATTDGNGTTKAEIFGLGAWGNDVYGFSRCYGCYDGGSNIAPALLQIDTSSGVATAVGSSFPFTNGWSGAGVTTKVTITVPVPPPTMPK